MDYVPSHCQSAPCLSWDTMLKMIKIKLELTPNPNMFIFFVKGARGGISYISNRFIKTKNKYLNFMTQSKNQNILYTQTQIIYMIMQCLSCVKKDEFKWIDPKEFDLNKYTTNNSKEYALGVDLEYPKELCELHNNFPLASDKLEIKEEMFPNIEY